MEDKKEEKVDVKNEDVLEDIEDIEEIEEISKEDGKASEVEAVSNEETSISNQSILKDDSEDNNSEDANNISDGETKINEDNPSLSTIKKDGKKVPIIVLLSILLVIDIAALVIYLIGVEKVISFIK